MIGMKMRVDGLHKLEIELAQQLAVTVDLFQHRIKNQRLAASTARHQVAVGAGNAVEQLAKDHNRTTLLLCRLSYREVFQQIYAAGGRLQPVTSPAR